MTTQNLSEFTHKVTQITQDYTHLITAIKQTRDHRKYDAIFQLKSYGFTYEQIGKASGYSQLNAISKWLYRNGSKYKDRKKKSKTQTTIEAYSEGMDYGTKPPTGFVSKLNNEDWGIKYLGYTWRKQYLRDMSNQIWFKNKVLVKIGRDHGKTWEMIKLFVRWSLEKRTKIICIATPAKLDEIYQAVLYFLQSDAIREDYGDVVIRSGAKAGIWFEDVHGFRTNPSGTHMVGPNFSTQPAEGSITGLHCDEGWLHLEDPVQDILVSDEAEARRWRWFKRTVRYIKGRGTKSTANGTSKDLGDFYHKMEHEAYYPVYTIPTLEVISGRLPTIEECNVDHDLEEVLDYPEDVGIYRISECPNYPIERVLYEFVFHTEDAHAELNNDPLPMEGFEFNKADWLEIDPIDEPFYKFQFVDPSFGTTGSKTAILVFGVYFNKLILIDAFVGYLGSTAFINKILEFQSKHGVRETWIEDNFNQFSRGLSVYNPLSTMEGLRIFITPPGKSKRVRISLLGGVFGSHIIEIYKTIPFKLNIEQEYLTFKSQLSDSEIKKKFNALDTIAMAYENLAPLLGTSKYPKRGSDTRSKSRASRTRSPFA